MTIIPLGPPLPMGSVPPTRGLGEQPVLPTARPPTWCCSGWRLPRFTRTGSSLCYERLWRVARAPRQVRSDSSLWPCSSPSRNALAPAYSVWALPSIPLCGARTFLHALNGHSDGLAGFGLQYTRETRAGGRTRHPSLRYKARHRPGSAQPARVLLGVTSGQRRRLASRRISRAALWPGMPVTPPPGCVPEPHRYSPGIGPR